MAGGPRGGPPDDAVSPSLFCAHHRSPPEILFFCGGYCAHVCVCGGGGSRLTSCRIVTHCRYSKGGGFIGSWLNGRRQGTGKSLYGGKWGYNFWEGPFDDDAPHGEGWMHLQDGSSEPFKFERGQPVATN